MKTTLKLNHMDLIVDLGEAVADPKLLNGGHPLHFVFKTKNATEVYLNHIYDILKDLPKGMMVTELFAGVGLFPKMLWDQLKPRAWMAIELDPSCREVYQEPRADFALISVYDVPQATFDVSDLVIVDNPNNTLRRMREDPQLKAMYDRIFTAKPRYVEITDVEYWWIHLQNHWPHYKDDFARLFGDTERPSIADLRVGYAKIFDAYIQDTYGYKVSNMRVGGGAQYFLLEPA